MVAPGVLRLACSVYLSRVLGPHLYAARPARTKVPTFANLSWDFRMYAEPEAAEAKTTSKADPTAPARSSIRRQRTVRYSPGTRMRQQSSSSSNPHRSTSGSSRARHLVDRQSLLEGIRRRNRESNRHASAEAMFSNISGLDAALGQGSSSLSHTADIAHAEATHRSRMETGRAHLRDALSYEHPTERIRSNNNSLRGMTSTLDAQPIDDFNFDELIERRSPSAYVPAPSYTSADLLAESPMQSTVHSPGGAAYTPGFPPAHRIDASRAISRLSARMVDLASVANQIRDLRMLPQYIGEPALESLLSEINSLMARNTTDLSQSDLVTETECIYRIRAQLEQLATEARVSRDAHSSIDTDLPNLAPVQRMSSREPGASRLFANSGHRNDLDGLGDRQRSFSPEAAVSWETMLTTIQPDVRVPSTHSSFTSTTASAPATSRSSSTTISSSYGSQVTHPTTTAEAEPCPTTETSNSDSDYQAEEMPDTISQQHRRAPAEFTLRAEGHLDRIASLSRRVIQQRSRSDRFLRNRRMMEREAELHRIELALQRLERQSVDDTSAPLGTQRSGELRAGRERL